MNSSAGPSLRRSALTWTSMVRSRTTAPARLAVQTLQQPELRRRQVERAAADVSPVPHPVDAHAEVLDHVGRFVAGFAAPLQGLDALDEDLHAEGLGHIVVGPQREADHLVR